VFFIILGCFLDGISMVVLTMACCCHGADRGHRPHLFGIFVVLVEMAQISPAGGLNLSCCRPDGS